MAPISDKKSQAKTQPLAKGNQHAHSHHGHHGLKNAHTKENNTTTAHPKRGLEILDFHESWLEEMEIYKDRLYIQKHQPHHALFNAQNQIYPSPQAVNHQLKSLSNNNRYTANFNKNLAALMTIGAHTDSSKSGGGAGGGGTRNGDNNHTATKSTSPKPRITIRHAGGASPVDTKTVTQRPIQRPHEENLSVSKSHAGGASNPKRHPSQHTRSHSHAGTPTTHSGNGKSHSKNVGSATTSGILATSTSSNPAAKPSSKVIVNQFHASSLLSSQQHDEKTKILTQNGLTKSAATAYETSLYASNYLPQDNRTVYGTKAPIDFSNYIGVSLAKAAEKNTAEDDPCAAIDDVNEYTDSDLEDDYVGYPFFLPEDGEETHQSRNIHYCKENATEDSDSEQDNGPYYRPNSILTPSIFPRVPPYLNFSSHAGKGPTMPPALHRVLKWRLSPVMPKIVKRVVLNSGFRIIKNTTDWMAVWEKHMKSPGFRTIRSHQKYNHMPGSFRIGRKDTMWRSIHENIKKYGKKQFGFMQRSYIMPDDLESLRQVWPKNASKLTKWIVKPPASARGTGIRIVNKWSQFPKDRPLVVQKYIERPLLINDNKFDMRIYVVLTSINPLRIYMYKDGLARFASVKYSSELCSLDDKCMHLTNYSINKYSQNYSKNEDFNACQGHKWTLQSLWSCLESRGVNTKRLWATLRNLVIKAIISGESGLNRMYRQNVNFRYNCFELFGFDVLLDENLIPWLLEINISPSLHSELPLDLHVKGPLIQAVLNTALYQVPPKLNEKQQIDILEELQLEGSLCHDKRIFTTCLTAEEVRKHNQFTNRSIEFREEYVDAILEHLLPDDLRCLIITEDEYARSNPLERVFPTPDSHMYLPFVDNPRYYNRLLDAWEHRYGNCREKGISILKAMCEEGYHLQVSDAALEKEPNVTLTEIDMLHQKKSDDTMNVTSTIAASSQSFRPIPERQMEINAK